MGMDAQMFLLVFFLCFCSSLAVYQPITYSEFAGAVRSTAGYCLGKIDGNFAALPYGQTNCVSNGGTWTVNNNIQTESQFQVFHLYLIYLK